MVGIITPRATLNASAYTGTFFPVISSASSEKRKPNNNNKPNNQDTTIACILNMLISALFDPELNIDLLEVTRVNVVGW